MDRQRNPCQVEGGLTERAKLVLNCLRLSALKHVTSTGTDKHATAVEHVGLCTCLQKQSHAAGERHMPAGRRGILARVYYPKYRSNHAPASLPAFLVMKFHAATRCYARLSSKSEDFTVALACLAD